MADNSRIDNIAEVIGGLLGLATAVIIAYKFQIDPTKEYGWWGGCWHSCLFVPHWILSWFDNDILLRAVYRTTAYNIFFWPGVVLCILTWIKLILRSIRLLRGR